LTLSKIRSILRAVPHSFARGVRVVTDVERGMRLTQACRRRSAWARTAKSCGPGTPTLVSSVACTKCDVTGARKPGPRGEREVSRKPLRREGRMFGQTCGSFPVLFYMHGAMGAACTRPSLRPPMFEGGRSSTTRAPYASRERGCTSCPRLIKARPSRRLLRKLLRMTFARRGARSDPHGEERRRPVSNQATRGRWLFETLNQKLTRHGAPS
jgi:hypothetical protein